MVVTVANTVPVSTNSTRTGAAGAASNVYPHSTMRIFPAPGFTCRIVFTVPDVAEVAVVDGGPVAAEVSAFQTMKHGAAIRDLLSVEV